LYEIHSKRPGFEDWFTIHIKLQDAIGAGRINESWAEQRAKQWGATSPIYLNRVLGEFSTTDSDGVIPLEWLEAAHGRWEDLEAAHRLAIGDLTAVAADVASEEGMAKTIVASRHGMVLSDLESLPHVDTMKTVGHVIQMLRNKAKAKQRHPPIAVIDAIGVGTGVVDRLREQGFKVDAFMGNSKPMKMDKTKEITFLNRRAEAWWGLRDLLNPAFSAEIAIPDIPTLTGDLIAPKFDQTSTGHIKIEDKDDIIKRLGRSPDEGDTVVMAFNTRGQQINLGDMVPRGIPKVSKWRKRR
jgi:hypothetical protein